jgi:hypothetical protein
MASKVNAGRYWRFKENMRNKRKLKYLTISSLLVIVLVISGLIALRYNIDPTETYMVDRGNLVEDGSFENFNQTAGDCCNGLAGEPSIFALKSGDSTDGNYSLELVSENHCACSSFPMTLPNKNSKYLLSFSYKGDKPRFCNWVVGDNKCIPDQKLLVNSSWATHSSLLTFTNLSESASIFFYADSDGTKTVTNLYDDLQVHKLGAIADPASYKFKDDGQYVIKTKADNVIHNGELISEVDATNGEAYFLVEGKPNVTIKFPWSEMIIVFIIVFVIVRLLLKKNEKAF